MKSRTWLLSGIPRSGSSLCCRLAGDLPDTVALSEPVRRDTFDKVGTRHEARARIEEFAAQARSRILVDRRAPSVQVDGRLDDNTVDSSPPQAGLRQRQGRQGEIEVHKPLSDNFTLLIKHNALFAALQSELAASFDCLALVRNPLAVLASWQTVNLPVHQGRIPAGEQFDGELQRVLAREPDVLRRQVAVLNWFFAAYRAHVSRENIIRYEDLVSSGGLVLFRLIGRAAAPPVPLENRNASLLYRGVALDTLMAALMQESGAWSEFYAAADCEQVADVIRSGPLVRG